MPTTLRAIPWNKEEEARLLEAYAIHGPVWSACAAYVGNGRTGRNCQYRWTEYLDPAMDHGPWTPAETAIIRALRIEPGKGSDSILRQECARALPRRPFYQCRSRLRLLKDPNRRMHKSQRRDVIPVVEVGKRPRATQRSRATTSDTPAPLPPPPVAGPSTPAGPPRSRSPTITFPEPSAFSSHACEIDPLFLTVQAAMALYCAEGVAEVDRIRSEEILSAFLLTG